MQGRGFEAKRDYALFHLMLATGIRLGSAVGLDVTDVDLDRGELWIRTTKGNRPDRVFLGKLFQEHLWEYIDCRTTGPLFQARNGKRLSIRQVQRRFAYWLEKAGLAASVSVHTLRSTFATRLYQKTGDIFLVKEALRHRSIMSTMVYARIDKKRLRQAIEY